MVFTPLKEGTVMKCARTNKDKSRWDNCSSCMNSMKKKCILLNTQKGSEYSQSDIALAIGFSKMSDSLGEELSSDIFKSSFDGFDGDGGKFGGGGSSGEW